MGGRTGESGGYAYLWGKGKWLIISVPEWMEMFRYTQEVGKTNRIDIDMNTRTGMAFQRPEVSLSQAAAKAILNVMR